LPVGFFDFIRAGSLGDAEDFVVVALTGHAGKESGF